MMAVNSELLRWAFQILNSVRCQLPAGGGDVNFHVGLHNNKWVFSVHRFADTLPEDYSYSYLGRCPDRCRDLLAALENKTHAIRISSSTISTQQIGNNSVVRKGSFTFNGT